MDGITALQADAPLRDGQIVEVEVTHADDFDLTARVLRVLREPVVTRRKLPIAAFGLETAWGR